ncbi:terminase small subunit [bacterium]|nr:terminase small subunit [bacterium]
MAKPDYDKFYAQWQDYDGKLIEFCNSRRPKLNYKKTQQVFKYREKKEEKEGETRKNTKFKDSELEITKPKKRGRPLKNKGIEEKAGVRKSTKNNVPVKLIELPEDLKITDQQKAFAIEYMRSKNQTEACMLTYGCSWESANANAYRLMGNDGIKLYIDYLYALEESAFIELRREVQERRKKISFSDFSKIGEFKGNKFLMYPDAEIDKDAVASLKTIKTKEERIENQYGGGVKIEMELTFHDPLVAMRDLLKERETERKETARHNSSELLELWERFQDTTREDNLTALDMAHELNSRGKDVPLSIQIQAKFELSVDDPDKGDGTGFDFETLNNRYAEYQKNLEEQVEIFIPERKSEIKALYLEQGFDGTEKPKDITIDEDNIVDPDK